MLRTNQEFIKKRTITQNLGKQKLRFMCTALPLDEIYPPQNFITIACLVLEICTGKNLSTNK